LQAAGLHECVTSSRQEYVNAAVSLAMDPSRLAQLRCGLRERFIQSPFGRAAEYTRGLERAYLTMRRRSR
jgi:predicted O-linked N-acetylglucosamine transferase (SPINDLY family)